MRLIRRAFPHSPADARPDQETARQTVFPSASLPGKGLTIFNIAGNRYRLSTTLRYDLGRVFIRHVMTHAEYDKRSDEGSL